MLTRALTLLVTRMLVIVGQAKKNCMQNEGVCFMPARKGGIMAARTRGFVLCQPYRAVSCCPKEDTFVIKCNTCFPFVNELNPEV